MLKKQLTRHLAMALLTILALLATACEATEQTDFGVDGIPPAPVLAAHDWLAERLAIDAEQIEIRALDQAEFADSCLGLGGPAESCAAVVTSGWQTTMIVNGEEYEVRVSDDGAIIRSPQFPTGEAEAPGS
ncbi:MAG: hypothetical protein KDE04_19810 [Anaerolineales bacterium]|nr:hypothetical protein [Anaerolineales bacterium]